MKLTRYFFIALFFIGNFSFSQNSIQQKVNAFASFSGFSNAGISFQAIDCSTGEVIANYNEKLSMAPASTMKLFATASAIEILGPNYQPYTTLYYDGIILSDSVLNGNIWIVGAGDMTLGSTYFNDNQQAFLKEWKAAIQALGIKTVQGNIIADGSSFGYEGAPDGWNWSDLGNYYGAGFSGLTVYDNMLKYHFRMGATGKAAGLSYTFPTVENFVFHNYIRAAGVSGDESYIYGAPYSLDRFGTGKLPANTIDFVVKGSLPDPEQQVAYELLKFLNESGLFVKGNAVSIRKTELSVSKNSWVKIADFKGKTVQEIATLTNHKSINLFAEGLLCNIGFKQTGNGSTSSSTDYIENYWSKRINTTGLYINDGSGLSRTNAVSASHYCALLKSMFESKNYSYFLKTLPIAGESGTLRSVCKGQAGHGKVKAKSGTMSRIKSYAGYIESSSGKKIAFAVIVNNYNCSNSATVDEMEKLFNALAVY